MKPLRVIRSTAISLPEENVDTDIIFPARFLVVTEKRGLARYAFYERRSDPAFVLNRPESKSAQILIAGANFGCGSSREQAPWALNDLGLAVLIAPSFGEIFAANCFKNGMLVIALPENQVERLHGCAERSLTIEVDLVARSVDAPELGRLTFSIGEDMREALLNGWNEIERIHARHRLDISRFEDAQKRSAPWLWATGKNNA